MERDCSRGVWALEVVFTVKVEERVRQFPEEIHRLTMEEGGAQGFKELSSTFCEDRRCFDLIACIQSWRLQTQALFMKKEE